MKILVPTDFSELAEVAVTYAAEFASATQNPLVLMNNISDEGFPRAGVLINLEEKVELNTLEDLRDLADKTGTSIDPAPDIFCEITKMSSDAKAILDKAAELNAGLIIMGTNGSSGLTGALLGSVSSRVIHESTIPVILIPSGAKFSSEGKIVFAVDLDTLPPDSTFGIYHDICKIFGKNPEFFFASVSGTEPELNVFKNKIINTFSESTPVFHTIADSDPVNAINEFLNSNNCMMLALAPGIHNLFDRIMGKSVTTKLISHSKIPVLSLP